MAVRVSIPRFSGSHIYDQFTEWRDDENCYMTDIAYMGGTLEEDIIVVTRPFIENSNEFAGQDDHQLIKAELAKGTIIDTFSINIIIRYNMETGTLDSIYTCNLMLPNDNNMYIYEPGEI